MHCGMFESFVLQGSAVVAAGPVGAGVVAPGPVKLATIKEQN